MGGGRDKQGVRIYRRVNGVYERLDGKPVNHRNKQQPEPKEKTFREKITEAKTKEELFSVLIDRYQPYNIRGDFQDKDINMLKRVFTTLDDLETQYPELAGKVHIFDGDIKRGRFAGMGLDGNLVLNENWNKEDDPQLFGDRNGWFHKNRTPEAIIAHEFTHAIQAKILEKMYPDDFVNGELKTTFYSNRIEILKQWNNGNFLKPIRREALKTLGVKIKDEKNALSQISRYAQYNIFESFAEAFADVYANGENASEVSKAYTNALIKALRS